MGDLSTTKRTAYRRNIDSTHSLEKHHLSFHTFSQLNNFLLRCDMIIRGLNLIGKLVKGRFRVKKCDSKLIYNKIFLPFNAHL